MPPNNIPIPVSWMAIDNGDLLASDTYGNVRMVVRISALIRMIVNAVRILKN